MRRAGVLALQGAVEEHMDALGRVGWAGVPVKRPEDLDGVDALILPGGESTAISRLMQASGLYDAVRGFAVKKPVMGTCAGLILVGSGVTKDEDGQDEHGEQGVQGELGEQEGRAGQNGRERVVPLRLMDSLVRRNGFGRQVDSFEADLDVEGVGEAVPGVFIRAPYIERLGPGAKALAVFEGRIVMAEQGKVLACSFHPELTGDDRVLRYFLAKAG